MFYVHMLEAKSDPLCHFRGVTVGMGGRGLYREMLQRCRDLRHRSGI